MSIFDQPTDEELAGFKEGDPVAIDVIVTRVLPQIYRWATEQYQNLPEDEVQSVVNQVMAETCRHYDRYDSRQAKFTTYVIGLVKRRMNDLWQTHSEIAAEEIEDSYENLDEFLYKESEDVVTKSLRDSFFDRVMSHLNEQERELLQIMREGEKRVEAFTKILQKYGPVEDPPREVKNAKERIQRKLRTIARDMRIDADDILEG